MNELTICTRDVAALKQAHDEAIRMIVRLQARLDACAALPQIWRARATYSRSQLPDARCLCEEAEAYTDAAAELEAALVGAGTGEANPDNGPALESSPPAAQEEQP